MGKELWTLHTASPADCPKLKKKRKREKSRLAHRSPFSCVYDFPVPVDMSVTVHPRAGLCVAHSVCLSTLVSPPAGTEAQDVGGTPLSLSLSL